ncbi:MAG TPA: glycoside hydrolase family 97 catalytic domain-containing protein [Steroidobacteraceae bacterium]|nr:glycoside hydrolase family 97 catalytic domain-containing protein [Steroidobacteraceae bacterium]
MTTFLARLARLCVLLCGAVGAGEAAQSNPVVVRSPSGRLEFELFTSAASGAATQVQYRVSLSDRMVVDASNLGVRLNEGMELGRNSVVVGTDSIEIDDSFEQYPGKRRHVVDRASQATITLRERGAKLFEWQLVVRAYDDGVALRYRFPKQPGWSDLELADELTEFAFPRGAVTTALPLAGFTTSHEGRYERRGVDEIPADWLLGLPLLVELSGVGWAVVLEANLTDYAGMYLARGTGSGNTLVSRLSPRPDKPKIAVRATLPHESPWRLILVGQEARQLVESDTVLKLNAPSAIADTSWIRPGKTTFPWWNDFFETGVPFKMGLNTETARYYIDFCAEYGIPYHTLDGVNGLAWYGGPIVPYEGADITQGIDGLDLQEVIAYARQKGVRLRLWMHWEAAKRHMARAFPLYRAWGIEGVMIDFMDRDDQEMVGFQRELLQLAADNYLTVTFHGVAAPTGLERTFPNLLNSEAVLNLEHGKWDEVGVTPEHDVTVPLTRMLAGPLDYHQGSLRGVPLDRFKPRVAEPLVIGTPARMLASYVVLQNHLPMMADYPSAYRRHPLTRLMAAIPSTWDDTVALAARVGEEVVIARRSGNDWWVGAMTDRHARDVRVPLSFLPAGMFQAETYRDDLATQQGFKLESREVTPVDELTLPLAAAGGALVRLTLIPEPPPKWRLVWSEDFDSLDPDKWELIDDSRPTNDSLQDSLPGQVRVKDGKLELLSENRPSRGLPYRSGKVASRMAQRLGRWEVRARLPGGSGVWPAIRLLPDGPWPAGVEIGIMENRGDQPTITSSSVRWGTQNPDSHESFGTAQQTGIDGQLVSYDEGFHTFACEWVDNQLRFYVDDMHHATYYNDEVGYLLPSFTAPMRLAIDTAVGGDFLPPPDATTVWPQRLLVDWVRVYELADEPGSRTFRNGGFDENGGSPAGWHIFGNIVDGKPNVLVHREAVRDGTHALKISGQGIGGGNYSGTSQSISVASGERVRARLAALVRSQEKLTDPNDRASMKIEFYNHWADYFGGPAMLGVQERAIADAATPTNSWHDYELEAVVPVGAIEARLTLVFGQASDEPGAVYIDAVEFERIP